MINFPNSPSQGQVFTSTTGLKYVFLDGVWRIVEAPQDIGKAEARNRLVNGAMQISQENGDTANSGSAYFPADQWQALFSTTGIVASQRLAAVTPNGSKYRFRYTATTGDASLAAGEFMVVRQAIEGSRLADFRFGSAAAKQAVLRFGFRARAGTYSVQLQNSATNRSYIANFTIAAGQADTDTEQVFVIPGDTTGTWLTDTGVGIYLHIVLASGSTFVGVSGWQAGNVWATSANTNGLAVNGNYFELFDVGLYLDPLNTGLAPPWVMPDEAEELRACQRYYSVLHAMFLSGYGAATQTIYDSAPLPAKMRTIPSVLYTNLANISNVYTLLNISVTLDSFASGVSISAAGAGLITFDAYFNARM